MDRQIQSFLLDGLHATWERLCNAAEGGAASSHRWPRESTRAMSDPTLPDQPVRRNSSTYSYSALQHNFNEKLAGNPAKTRAAGKAGLRV
jgi:hypothetical protein